MNSHKSHSLGPLPFRGPFPWWLVASRLPPNLRLVSIIDIIVLASPRGSPPAQSFSSLLLDSHTNLAEDHDDPLPTLPRPPHAPTHLSLLLESLFNWVLWEIEVTSPMGYFYLFSRSKISLFFFSLSHLSYNIGYLIEWINTAQPSSQEERELWLDCQSSWKVWNILLPLNILTRAQLKKIL